MPYTKQTSRTRFNKSIKEVIEVIMGGQETKLVKGEYFGFLINRIVKLFARTGDVNLPSFNSVQFNERKRTYLTKYADKLVSMVNSDDPLSSAGDLNYVISSIWWGILGDTADIDEANYGFRVYLRGCLEQIHDNLKKSPFVSGSPSENTMTSRRYIFSQGVVGDVLDETYARKTRPYEDKKIEENGDLWVNGELLQEELPIVES